MREARLTPRERERFLAAAGERRARFAQAKCNYWVFEEMHGEGALVEFIEAGDADVLGAALAREGDSHGAAPRLYREVELG